MTNAEARREIIKLWLEKAADALDSAELELNQGHITFAVNRLYYSCFYAVTALLLQDSKQFARHSAVRSEFTRLYIKSGKVDVKWSKFYQRLFDARQEADYIPTTVFEKSEALEQIKQAEEFIDLIKGIIKTNLS
ncbi:MAG: HEPN domain-containing protein [Sedimentisphaerales bacterium]|nr:HEPN domain-containing protein [Sedimentisphaerales bacterium]